MAFDKEEDGLGADEFETSRNMLMKPSAHINI
jgi:hypothetical protein